MSTYKTTVEHPKSGRKKDIYEGFSWPGFFFTPIWLFIKRLTGHAVMYLLISLFTVGIGGVIYSVVVGFKGNEWTEDHLYEKGYEPHHTQTGKKLVDQ